MNKKSVLFISHEASRTGAPIVLLNFLKWFKANTDISFQILIRSGGELQHEFEALAPTYYLYSKPSIKRRIINRIAFLYGRGRDHAQVYLDQLKQEFRESGVSLIYSNSMANGDVLELLKDLQCPVITHVHELEGSIQEIGAKNIDKVKKYTTHFIAVAEAVKDNLLIKHKIERDKIDLVYAFTQTKSYQLDEQLRARHQIREELGIPQFATIVGAAGTISWRKGSDLFIQLAHAVYKRHPQISIHFLWLGGSNSGSIGFAELEQDIEKLGLQKYIHFVGLKTNPLDYFATFDIFTLMSREDPFPLVCLEVASVGKPILCFDKSGGEKDFVEDDCGFVIPYLDVELMAEKVLTLVNSTEISQSMGARALQKVQERHDTQANALKLVSIILKFLELH